MNRDIFSVLRILMTQGFTNASLRAVLNVFMDRGCPLAFNMAWYDKLTNDAEHISQTFDGNKTSIVVIQKVV